MTLAEVGATEIGTGTLWDVARIVFLVLPGVAILGMAVVIVRSYYRSWNTDRRIAAAQGVPSRWRGLLPQHVWLIGSSYVLFDLIMLVEVVTRFREPTTWRFGLYAPAVILGVIALWSMMGHQRHRLVTVDLDYHVDQLGSDREERPPG